MQTTEKTNDSAQSKLGEAMIFAEDVQSVSKWMPVTEERVQMFKVFGSEPLSVDNVLDRCYGLHHLHYDGNKW